MVNESAQKILDEFKVLIAQKEPKAEEPVGAPLSLAERLKNKMRESKLAGGMTDFVFEEQAQYFTKRISESSINPIKHHQKLLGGDGKEYDVVCNIRNSRCEIISELFPQPFFVVTEDFKEELKGMVYTVKEFLTIAKVANKLGGTIKFQ